jgi:hypothetical protein
MKQISKTVYLFQNVNNGKIAEIVWTQPGYKCVCCWLLPLFQENKRIPWSPTELEDPTS